VYRAAEQTSQRHTQVAGRAGRGDKPGEVFIQTFRPRHYAIAAAAMHNYPAFYEKEIEKRREAGYPPFRRMAHFLIESEDAELAGRESFRLRNGLQAYLRDNGLENVELVGPAPAAVRRVNKLYRWNLAAFSRSSAHVNAIARAARGRFDQEHSGDKVRLKIDLDPHGMY
jgi:primosomal protein N' (replication factor Y)